MKILMVCSEMVPFAKTGGLGDMVAALTAELGRLQHDVRVVMPRYYDIDTLDLDCEGPGEGTCPILGAVTLYGGSGGSGRERVGVSKGLTVPDDFRSVDCAYVWGEAEFVGVVPVSVVAIFCKYHGLGD